MSLLPRCGAAALLLMPLAACVSAPPPAEPPSVDIPAHFAAETTAAAAAATPWWQSFGDPRLDALIREALAHNPDLAAAAAGVEAAVAEARIAGADRWPTLDAGVSAARRQQVFVGLPIPGAAGPLKSESDSFSASLNLSWELDLWGRLRATQRAAGQDLAAVRADYAAAALSLAGQTIKAWLGLVEAERQVALAAATVDSRKRTAERVEARYRRGLVPPLDLRLGRANLALAEADLAQRLRLRDAAGRALEILLGRYPAGELASGSDLPGLPPPVPAGLPAELVTRRPDLQAAEARLEAAGWRVAEARAALFPRLSLTASGGTSSDQLGDLVDGDFSVWNVAGNLLQPLFQGGRLRAAVTLREAGRERVLHGYTASTLAAFAEVERALAAESFLATEEAALVVNAEEAGAAARLAEDRYMAGVGDYLLLLDSQRQGVAAESRLLAVRRQHLTNRVDLHLALGGDLPATTSEREP